MSALAEDAQGRLWIGTNSGAVAWFDAATGRFVPAGAGGGPRGTVS